MFKNAARKIAHNSTLPSLAGKQDLRALQDLIIQEKTVLTLLQKLSAEFGRSADYLRVWGQGEGDDLGDTLSASATLLQLFSSAMNVLGDHELKIRDIMKTVRTREENLDELKRRRKSVFSDAEGAERKLSKMNPDNKNLQQQADLLNRLREEIRTMDAEIMTEEAALGDYKRASVREWMGLKFGGLLEYCEKGRVVGELGKLVISEIPIETTQPGLPRAYYSGHARTEFLLAEAQRSVSEVGFSSEPDPNPSHRSIRPLPGAELPPIPSSSPPPQTQRRMSMGSMNSIPYAQGPGAGSQFNYAPSMTGAYPGLPQVEETGFTLSPFISDTSNPSVGEFGSFSSPPNQPSSFNVVARERASSPRAGRFATFPVKAIGPRPPPGAAQGSTFSTNPYLVSPPPLEEGDRPPSLDIGRENDESFSSSVASALGRQFTPDGPSGGSSSRPVAPQIPPQDVKSGLDFGPQRYSPPPPVYTPSDNPTGATSSHGNLDPSMNGDVGSSSRPHSTLLDPEDGLAYMSSNRANESTESVSDSGDRRVRFGGVVDVNQELEQRRSTEGRRHVPASSMHARVPVPPLEEDSNDLQPSEQNGRLSPEVHRPQPASPTNSDSDSRRRSPSNAPWQARAPTPPAMEALLDERALNAAAAREVSREMDALMISSPSILSQDLPPPSPSSSHPTYGASPYQARSVSPMPPSNTSNQPRSVSPLPPLNTSQQFSEPQSASQTMSPRLEGMYVRHRDRSGSSPATRTPVQTMQEAIPTPSSPTPSEGSDQRPLINVSRTSPTPSTDTNDTLFRTPLSTPSGMPGPGPMYALPGTAGSNPSFSAQAPPRKIPAAAFRRPQPQIRSMSGDNGMGLTDTNPLNVKKRLPSPYQSPVASPMLQVAPGYGAGAGVRSVSTPYMSPSLGPPSEPDRPVSHYHQDDVFDISAYTEGPDRASGYEYNNPGRLATNINNSDSIR